MKIHNIAICSFILLAVILSACTMPNEKPREITAQIPDAYGNLVQLQIKISCNKSVFAMDDLVAFDVRIVNSPVDDYYNDISVFNPVKLGNAGGLTITVAGPEGNEVFPKEEADGQDVQSVIDHSWPYSTLDANNYLGAIYKDSAKNIFQEPGEYFVFAEYLSPVTKDYIKKPEDPEDSEDPEDQYEGPYRFSYWIFWGREIGPIRSAPLKIKVTE